MQISGLGTDIVEISRIRKAVERYGQRFLDRIYTQEEQDYCWAKRDPCPSLAARFAAKEAVSKALGTGISGELAWKDIEVISVEGGTPCIALHGTFFDEGDGSAGMIRVSLSHSRDYAMAVALIEK